MERDIAGGQAVAGQALAKPAPEARRSTEPTPARERRCVAESGFTMLEMLVVLAVVSVFAGIISSVVVTSLTSAELEANDLKIEVVTGALLSYYRDTDDFPVDTGSDESDLAALAADPGVAGWNGPYLYTGFEANDFSKDAWKRTFTYTYFSGAVSCEVRSKGPDGSVGTADDVAVTVNAASAREEKARKVRDELEVVKVAAQAYASSHGGLYPLSINDLYASSYLSDESFRTDLWATAYQVSSNQFISCGPDRALGGGDDILPY
jgi:general secretion pathway protein G